MATSKQIYQTFLQIKSQPGYQDLDPDALAEFEDKWKRAHQEALEAEGIQTQDGASTRLEGLNQDGPAGVPTMVARGAGEFGKGIGRGAANVTGLLGYGLASLAGQKERGAQFSDAIQQGAQDLMPPMDYSDPTIGEDEAMFGGLLPSLTGEALGSMVPTMGGGLLAGKVAPAAVNALRGTQAGSKVLDIVKPFVDKAVTKGLLSVPDGMTKAQAAGRAAGALSVGYPMGVGDAMSHQAEHVGGDMSQTSVPWAAATALPYTAMNYLTDAARMKILPGYDKLPKGVRIPLMSGAEGLEEYGQETLVSLAPFAQEGRMPTADELKAIHEKSSEEGFAGTLGGLFGETVMGTADRAKRKKIPTVEQATIALETAKKAKDPGRMNAAIEDLAAANAAARDRLARMVITDDAPTIDSWATAKRGAVTAIGKQRAQVQTLAERLTDALNGLKMAEADKFLPSQDDMLLEQQRQSEIQNRKLQRNTAAQAAESRRQSVIDAVNSLAPDDPMRDMLLAEAGIAAEKPAAAEPAQAPRSFEEEILQTVSKLPKNDSRIDSILGDAGMTRVDLENFQKSQAGVTAPAPEQKKAQPAAAPEKLAISPETHPLITAVKEAGGMVPKSAAKNPGGEYDGAPDIKEFGPQVSRFIYGANANVKPDQMAEKMHSLGLIPDGHPNTLWAAIEAELGNKRQNLRQTDTVTDAHMDHWEENESEAKTANDLRPGDRFTVYGEEYEVAGDDTTTGERRLKIRGTQPENEFDFSMTYDPLHPDGVIKMDRGSLVRAGQARPAGAVSFEETRARINKAVADRKADQDGSKISLGRGPKGEQELVGKVETNSPNSKSIAISVGKNSRYSVKKDASNAGWKPGETVRFWGIVHPNQNPEAPAFVTPTPAPAPERIKEQDTWPVEFSARQPSLSDDDMAEQAPKPYGPRTGSDLRKSDAEAEELRSLAQKLRQIDPNGTYDTFEWGSWIENGERQMELRPVNMPAGSQELRIVETANGYAVEQNFDNEGWNELGLFYGLSDAMDAAENLLDLNDGQGPLTLPEAQAIYRELTTGERDGISYVNGNAEDVRPSGSVRENNSADYEKTFPQDASSGEVVVEEVTPNAEYQVSDATRRTDNTPERGSVGEAQQLQLFTTGAAPAIPAATVAAQAGIALGQEGVLVQTGRFKTKKPIRAVNTHADAASIFAPLAKGTVEGFSVLIVDKAGKPLGVVVTNKGLKAEVATDPAVVAGVGFSLPDAAGFWISHNHPSGRPSPSPADIDMTEVIKNLARGSAIDYKGHVIVARNANGWQFFNVDQQQTQPEQIPDPATRATRGGIPQLEQEMQGNYMPLSQYAVQSDRDVIAIGKDMVSKGQLPPEGGIILLNHGNYPVGALPIAFDDLKKLRTGTRGTGSSLLLENMAKTSADGFVGYYPALKFDGSKNVSDTIANLERFGNASLLYRFLDITNDQIGAQASGLKTGVTGTIFESARTTPDITRQQEGDTQYDREQAGQAGQTGQQTATYPIGRGEAEAGGRNLDLLAQPQLQAAGNDPGGPRGGREAVAMLNERIAEIHGAHYQGAFEAVNPDTLNTTQKLVQDVMQRVLGKNVHYFRDRSARVSGWHGLFDKRQPDNLFVEVNTDKPFMVVAGHEALHSIKESDPDLYDEFMDYMRPLMINKDRYRAENLSKQKTYGESAVNDEMAADFAGDNLGRVPFWEELADRNPSLFARVAEHIRRLFDRVKRFLSREKPRQNFGSEAFITDLEAGSNALKDLIEGVASRRQAMRDTNPAYRALEDLSSGVAAETDVNGNPLVQAVEDLSEAGRKKVQVTTDPNTIKPADADLTAPEMKALRKNLDAHKGTPWATSATRAIGIRADIVAVIDGKKAEPEFIAGTTLADHIKRSGREGIFTFLSEAGIIGDVQKPKNAVNASMVNCDPSACSGFCYACKGNYVINPYADEKGEIIDLAARDNPSRLGKDIADEYKTTTEYDAGKALRLFDRGDLSEPWLKVIQRLNAEGVRAHVFSKKPELLSRVDPKNVRLLSIDASNLEKADGNDLPIAFVYSDPSELPDLERLRKRVRVVLVVQGGSPAKVAKLNESLPEWVDRERKNCPIDSGMKSRKEWNCTKCDAGKGIGCYGDQPTTKMHKQVDPLMEINDIITRIEEGHADGRIQGNEELFRRLARLQGLLGTPQGKTASAIGQGDGTGDQGGRSQTKPGRKGKLAQALTDLAPNDDDILESHRTAETDVNGNPLVQAVRAMGPTNGQVSPTVATSGDVEVVIPDSVPSSISNAAEIARKEIGKILINEPTGIEATLSRNAIAKMTSGSATVKSTDEGAHATVLANIRKVFETAVLGETHGDRDNNPDIRAIHRFFAPVRMDDRTLRAKITVKEFAAPEQGRRIYSIEAVEIETPTRKRAEGQKPSVPQVGVDKIKVSELLGGVKDVSGQPLVPESDILESPRIVGNDDVLTGPTARDRAWGEKAPEPEGAPSLLQKTAKALDAAILQTASEKSRNSAVFRKTYEANPLEARSLEEWERWRDLTKSEETSEIVDRHLEKHIRDDNSRVHQIASDVFRVAEKVLPEGTREWAMKKVRRVLSPTLLVNPTQKLLARIVERVTWNPDTNQLEASPGFRELDPTTGAFTYQDDQEIPATVALEAYNSLPPVLQEIVLEHAKQSEEYRRNYVRAILPAKRAEVLALLARSASRLGGPDAVRREWRDAFGAIRSELGRMTPEERLAANIDMDKIDHFQEMIAAAMRRTRPDEGLTMADRTKLGTALSEGDRLLSQLSSDRGVFGYLHHTGFDPASEPVPAELREGTNLEAFNHPWFENIAASQKKRHGAQGYVANLFVADTKRDVGMADAGIKNKWMQEVEDLAIPYQYERTDEEGNTVIKKIADQAELDLISGAPGEYNVKHWALAKFGKNAGKRVFLPSEAYDRYQAELNKKPADYKIKDLKGALDYLNDNWVGLINRALLFHPAKAARDLAAVPFHVVDFITHWAISNREDIPRLPGVIVRAAKDALFDVKTWERLSRGKLGEYSEVMAAANEGKSQHPTTQIMDWASGDSMLGSVLSAMTSEFDLAGGGDIPVKRFFIRVGEQLADARGLEGAPRERFIRKLVQEYGFETSDLTPWLNYLRGKEPSAGSKAASTFQRMTIPFFGYAFTLLKRMMIDPLNKGLLGRGDASTGEQRKAFRAAEVARPLLWGALVYGLSRGLGDDDWDDEEYSAVHLQNMDGIDTDVRVPGRIQVGKSDDQELYMSAKGYAHPSVAKAVYDWLKGRATAGDVFTEFQTIHPVTGLAGALIGLESPYSRGEKIEAKLGQAAAMLALPQFSRLGQDLSKIWRMVAEDGTIPDRKKRTFLEAFGAQIAGIDTAPAKLDKTDQPLRYDPKLELLKSTLGFNLKPVKGSSLGGEVDSLGKRMASSAEKLEELRRWTRQKNLKIGDRRFDENDERAVLRKLGLDAYRSIAEAIAALEEKLNGPERSRLLKALENLPASGRQYVTPKAERAIRGEKKPSLSDIIRRL